MNEQRQRFYAVWRSNGDGSFNGNDILFPSVAKAEKYHEVRVNPVTLESDEYDEHQLPAYYIETVDVPLPLVPHIQAMYEQLVKYWEGQR